MKCPGHPRNEVIGYCSVCGAFGCDECLTRMGDSHYCPRHYRQAVQREEEARRQGEARRRHSRQKMVVRFSDGRLAYGYCLALNPKDMGFHLELVDRDSGTALGKTIPVQFRDLKAVFFVKSFDGEYDKNERFREWIPEGGELIVEFKDGELIRGTSLHRYDPRDPRFYLVPADGKSNNISILVESEAVAGVYTPEEYQAKLAQKRAQRAEGAGTELSQEETLGDFYFDTRNYPGALEQFELAAKRFPQSIRLRKKILATQYNLGVHCIKSRDFPGAMAWMQKILKVDPENSHARKKVAQLNKILDKGSRAGSAEALD
jgi:hypothetical protein